MTKSKQINRKEIPDHPPLAVCFTASGDEAPLVHEKNNPYPNPKLLTFQVYCFWFLFFLKNTGARVA
jgi:hypothetical protein